jgi:hypothetical protein
MGLVRGMTTLNTKKRKRKMLSVAQREKLKVDLRDYNKRMKQNHCHNLCMTLDEYVDYVQGYFKPRQTHQYTQSYRVQPKPKVRETQEVPSIQPTPKSTNSVPGNGGTKRNWKEQQERLEISKQYSIVPAYNKGPYMVVSKDELKTAGKKV